MVDEGGLRQIRGGFRLGWASRDVARCSVGGEKRKDDLSAAFLRGVCNGTGVEG